MLRRVTFFICGAVTVLIGRVYGSLSYLALTPQFSWLPFSYALLTIGILAVCISFLPSAWIQRANQSRFTPLKFLSSFAVLGLFLTIAMGLIPPGSTHSSPTLVYSLCPACAVMVMVDPSLPTVIFLLAPLNALIFGAVGGVIGTAVGMISR
jgi:ribose/xylose/arabinose/galactoside ABC-type transport system permease subunit